MKKILYGISGIGNGHANRQAPIIEHFSRTSRMMIFAYQESYRHYAEQFKKNRSVTVVPVDVPFWAGNRKGLDFLATVGLNKGKDFLEINCKAMAQAEKQIGRPDLVITDYEPVCAQYAYAMNAPLVTLDQQSKYLIGDFPHQLGGQTYEDEIVRLSMFFPKADARIACSFFQVKEKKDIDKKVLIFPSTLKESITLLKRKPSKYTSILVYLSSQRAFVQSFDEVVRICDKYPDAEFHLFVKGADTISAPKNSRVRIYEHGDPRFYKILETCSGIISTAGHMLLSEAMYLGIPVYAIPLAVYEQQMNAYVIDQNGFGISHPKVEKKKVREFVKNLAAYEKNIENDQAVLLREPGQQKIIHFLNGVLEKSK
ncbi:MAG TPA: glycosyltransferase family protein [Patescibacteria group bacterium]|nr:glycosyltransferase family protein [Patescibacteria group bacterium]